MESLAASARGSARSRFHLATFSSRPLVGDFIRRPGWIWLTHIAPISLLLIGASRVYVIIAGDMTGSQRQTTLVLGLTLAAVLVGAGSVAVRNQRARRLLSDAQSAVLLTLSLFVLGISVLFCWTMIPDSEPDWIVNRWELLCESFCLGMPGTFHAILILSSRPLRRHGGVEFGFLLLAAGLVATLSYGLAAGFASVAPPLRLPDSSTIMLAMIAALGGGVTITAAVTRATLIAYTRIRRMSPLAQRGFMFVVAFAGPLAGLYLNKSIPFPVDFQAPAIYLLAFVTGLALMLPAIRSLFWHRVVWLAQCALFPFSAYFFLVFLPWLPLSFFAMAVCGAGFLMLVPLVLGIAHAYRLIDGFREEVRDGRAWPVALLGLGTMLFLPALGLETAWSDRVALDQALTYIYSPDYRHDITFPGNLSALASSLQHLRDAKQGIFLPFLTPLYDQIVFHGLVLPDAKINELQTAFFGEAATAMAGFFLRSPHLEVSPRPAPFIPARDVILDGLTVTVHRDGASGTARLLLTLRNLGPDGSEFDAGIHLPEGVYVSGFALRIDNDFVPARIVEKKTAQWVCEKITAARSDPGLLLYTTHANLSLRIAPFARNEVRQARLDLVYANTAPLTITFDNTNVPLEAATPPPTPLAVTTCATDSGSVALANPANVPPWQLRRTPYLDILIDCSRGTSYSPASLARAIDQARHAFPSATLARVTAINFEARDIVPNLIPIGQLNPTEISGKLPPHRGGLLQDHFLKRELLLAHDLMQTGPDRALLRPQFILISSLGQDGRKEEHLDDFLRLSPDARVVFTEDSDGLLNGEDLVSREPASAGAVPNVLLWRWDHHYEISEASPRAAIDFPGGLNAGALKLYDPQSRQFIAAPPGSAIPSDSRFADGVRTWAAQDEAEFNPRLLKDGASALIGLSQQTGILIPDSAYIAVESAAQSRAMEEKEKQKLRNNPVYELEEPIATPEPATWLLLGVGLLVLAGFGPAARAGRCGARAAGGSEKRPCCRPPSCKGP